MSSPYFSIVIPIYNRPQEASRAIDSCLSQTFDSFEVIAVDDGSTDSTLELLSSRSDPRLTIVRHERNRGVCPARNTGVRKSTGRWIIFLDSDHELLPGALATAAERTTSLNGVNRIGFMFSFDDGRTSPDPLPEDGPLDYPAYLRWVERVVWSDALWATKRETFDRCRFPESYALETSYHLAFAKEFVTAIVPVIVAHQHTDSAQRLTLSWSSKLFERRKEIKMRDYLEDWRLLLEDHGRALQALAPNWHDSASRYLATLALLNGRRAEATGIAMSLLRRHPLGWKDWLLMALSLGGRRIVPALLAYKQSRGQRFRVSTRKVEA